MDISTFCSLSCLLCLAFSCLAIDGTVSDQKQDVTAASMSDRSVHPQLQRRQLMMGALGAGVGLLGYKAYKSIKDRWRCGPGGAYCYDGNGDGISDYGMNPWMMNQGGMNGMWGMNNGMGGMNNGMWGMNNGMGGMNNGMWGMNNGMGGMNNGMWGMNNGMMGGYPQGFPMGQQAMGVPGVGMPTPAVQTNVFT